MYLLNQIEPITHAVVEAVKRMQIENVYLVDTDGRALPQLAAAYPAAVAEVLKSLFATTGVDVPGLLAGPRADHAIGTTGGRA
jgi:flotillin